jgi:hypothetical protein
MPFVLLGWLIGTQFDCFNLNGHLFGLLGLVMACTLPGRAPASGVMYDRARQPRGSNPA